MHINYNLTKNVLAWYDNNKRNLPWRVSKKSPKKLYYRILSEFMLQQTQVKTVVPYFKKFTKEFPTLRSLSKSSETKILKFWEGLGYYNRARNLLFTVREIVNKKKEKLPKTLDEIKELPGIGDYTGSALLGLVHDQAQIALDVNVKRFFSRIIDKNVSDLNFDLLIRKNKKNLFHTNRNSDLIEALIEFGALVCKPKKPDCHNCCIRKNCRSFKLNKKFEKNNKVKKVKKSYNIFCYLNKKKQIALTKNNNLGFLDKFILPDVRNSSCKINDKTWKFLCNYNNSISNKKLKINLYYKFSKKIPPEFNWYSIQNNKEFVPTFTKKIFKQVSILY